MSIVFDFSELKGRIITRYQRYALFAEAIGLSRAQLSERLSGKVNFKPDEIHLACGLLGIPAEEIGVYFFTPKV